MADDKTTTGVVDAPAVQTGDGVNNANKPKQAAAGGALHFLYLGQNEGGIRLDKILINSKEQNEKTLKVFPGDKVEIIGTGLQVFGTVLLALEGSSGVTYRPKNLFIDIDKGAYIKFEIPNLGNALGDNGGTLAVHLLSKTQPAASGIVHTFLSYHNKTKEQEAEDKQKAAQSEEEKRKEYEKKQFGKGAVSGVVNIGVDALKNTLGAMTGIGGAAAAGQNAPVKSPAAPTVSKQNVSEGGGSGMEHQEASGPDTGLTLQQSLRVLGEQLDKNPQLIADSQIRNEVLQAMQSGNLTGLSAGGQVALNRVLQEQINGQTEASVQVQEAAHQISGELSIAGGGHQRVRAEERISAKVQGGGSATTEVEQKVSGTVSGSAEAKVQQSVSGGVKQAVTAEVDASKTATISGKVDAGVAQTAAVSQQATATGKIEQDADVKSSQGASVSTSGKAEIKAQGPAAPSVKQKTQIVGEFLEKNPGLVLDAKARARILDALNQGDVQNLEQPDQDSLRGVLQADLASLPERARPEVRDAMQDVGRQVPARQKPPQASAAPALKSEEKSVSAPPQEPSLKIQSKPEQTEEEIKVPEEYASMQDALKAKDQEREITKGLNVHQNIDAAVSHPKVSEEIKKHGGAGLPPALHGVHEGAGEPGTASHSQLPKETESELEPGATSPVKAPLTQAGLAAGQGEEAAEENPEEKGRQEQETAEGEGPEAGEDNQPGLEAENNQEQALQAAEEGAAKQQADAQAKARKTEAELQKAMKEANKVVDAGLMYGVDLAWASALPTFTLSVWLGAIIGDLLWIFKSALIQRLIRPLLKTEALKKNANKIAQQVKISSKVKLNILGMNLVVLAEAVLVLLAIFIVVWVGCNYPIKQLSIMKMHGLGSICEAVDNATTNLVNSVSPVQSLPTGSTSPCSPVLSGPASVASLQTTCFGTNAMYASMIANAESRGVTTQQSNSDKCGNDSVSWGLFQINLTAHPIGGLNCPKAFDHMFTGNSSACKVIDRNLYDQCVQAAQNPLNNITEACRISTNGQHWGAWGANRKCALPN